MNQTINQLERDRKEKIRNLNPEETEAYINSLNNKIYTALADKDYDKQNYYNDKLVEASLILKERYSNIPMVVSVSKIYYLSADLLCERINSSIRNYIAISDFIHNFNYHLFMLKYHLEEILHIYYFNCFNHIGCSVTNAIHSDLWEKLDEDIFMKITDNHDFYRDDSYHKMLLNSFDRVIEDMRDDFLRIFEICEDYQFLSDNLYDRIESAKENFESEKEYIFKNIKDKHIKILKDRNYLDLLLKEIETMSFCLKVIDSYKNLKKDILEVINGDSFELFKSIEYDSNKKHFDNFTSNKESYIKSKPSYNIRNLKLKLPSYYSRVYEDD